MAACSAHEEHLNKGGMGNKKERSSVSKRKRFIIELGSWPGMQKKKKIIMINNNN